MISAIPEGLAVDSESDADFWADAMRVAAASGRGLSHADAAEAIALYEHRLALGIICHAAAKCTEVQSLADCGRIDRDGADLFVRRYSESIADIVALIAPAAPKQKGN